MTTKTEYINRQIVEKTKMSAIDFSIVRNKIPKLGRISDAISKRLSI